MGKAEFLKRAGLQQTVQRNVPAIQKGPMLTAKGMFRGPTHVHDAGRRWAGTAFQLARVYWLPFSVTGITGAVQFVTRRRR